MEQFLAAGMFMVVLEVITLPVLALVLSPCVAASVFLKGQQWPTFLGLMVVVAWHLGLGWLSRSAARHWTAERTGFAESLRLAVGEGRVYLSFVPVIGPLVRPKSLPER